MTNAFTEKCLSSPVFCILEFLLSLHFGLVAPCCLFGSSIVFRILSYLSSFFCLFVFSGRISPSKTVFCYHKGKSLSGGLFASLLPLCFCHHSLCTWLPPRTPAAVLTLYFKKQRRGSRLDIGTNHWDPPPRPLSAILKLYFGTSLSNEGKKGRMVSSGKNELFRVAETYSH